MLRKDTLGPDSKHSNANFTNCSIPGATSTGNWDGHGSGDYSFVVDYGSNIYAPVSVSSLTASYLSVFHRAPPHTVPRDPARRKALHDSHLPRVHLPLPGR